MRRDGHYAQYPSSLKAGVAMFKRVAFSLPGRRGCSGPQEIKNGPQFEAHF
jgi:hypothetical protein